MRPTVSPSAPRFYLFYFLGDEKVSSYAGVDFFKVDALLSEEERAVRDTVREWVDEQLMPIIGFYRARGRYEDGLKGLTARGAGEHVCDRS